MPVKGFINCCNANVLSRTLSPFRLLNPYKHLLDGGDTPRESFNESNCSLAQLACPGFDADLLML